MPGNIIIRTAHTGDIPAVISIADHEFGKDYITPAQLEAYVMKGGKYIFKVAEKEHGRIAGFCLSIVLNKDELSSYIRDAETLFDKTGNTGIIKTIAVDNDFKGRGISTMLIEASLRALEAEHGIRQFCSIGWKYSDTINIKNTLERLGFTAVKEIPDYWKDYSIRNDFSCPICGNPCRCAAVIFVKIYAAGMHTGGA